MSATRLTEREQLIESILQMPDDQIMAVAEFIQNLEDNEDLAIIAARKDEDTISLDDYLRESGLSREDVEKTARAEGWIK